MAHEIDMTGGLARAAFARTPAWHGLGTVVPDQMQPTLALRLAGMEWEVCKRSVYYHGSEGSAHGYFPINNRWAVVRKDNNGVLGIVGDTYTPVQNAELAKFIEAVCGEGAKLESLGSLRDGQRVWFLLDLNTTYEPIKGDPVKSYMAFTNGFDGVTRLRMLGTDVRIVCANTWAVAMDGVNERAGIQFRHDGTIGDYTKKAQEYIARHFLSADERKAQSEALAKRVKLHDAEMAEFFVRRLNKLRVPKDKHREALEDLAALSAAETNTVGGMAGTGWAAFQIWSEYLDYRPGRQTQASRWESNLLGEFARSKKEAWSELLAVAT
jgi:phage/plasmid-like protein (TIGR03299 family)